MFLRTIYSLYGGDCARVQLYYRERMGMRDIGFASKGVRIYCTDRYGRLCTGRLLNGVLVRLRRRIVSVFGGT
jgi:hypothetical protein